MKLNPGDHVRVHRGLYHHDGIYVGEGRIIHLWAPAGKGGASIRVDSLADVCGPEGTVSVWQYAGGFDPTTVVGRAYSRLGEQGYNALFDNCEHFATWCKTGEHSSSQAERGLVAIGGAVVSRAAASLGISAVGMLGLEGFSGAGIMSGLAALGGSAAVGIGVVAAGPAAAATLAMHRALRDDPFLPQHERGARRNGRRATTVAAVAGTGGALGLVSAAGVPGLSAVGLTTGLAAVGGTMLGGLLTVALLPAVAAAVAGTVVYRMQRPRRSKVKIG